MHRYFSKSYRSARTRFVGLAAERGLALERHRVEGSGPEGELLTIDVAIASGGPRPRRTVLVTSGVHGVEGFTGSAVQLALLKRGLPDDVRVVLVHALNPFGMAWIRRADGDNIDLNRNFLPPDRAYEGAPPLYGRVAAAFSPMDSRGALDQVRAWATMLGSPDAEVKQGVAGGQYEHPTGIFFGGHGPSRAHQVVEAEIERWVGEPEHVVLVDIHTGLGAWADYALLVGAAPGSPELQRLVDAYGDKVEALTPTEGTYAVEGDFAMWLDERLTRQGRQVDALGLEFGTWPAAAVLLAMLVENRAVVGRLEGARLRAAKRLMMEAFCPRSRRWRRRVVEQALEVMDKVLA